MACVLHILLALSQIFYTNFDLGTENENEQEEGTYFVDQAGHYYFQAKGSTQPVMTVMPAISSTSDPDDFVINQENDEEGEDSEDVRLYIF